jgi:hypothetical protein
MRKKLLFFLTIMVIFTVGFISGCGGCSCQDEHDSHTQQYVEDLERLNEQTSNLLPSEAELGVPVYDDNLDPSSIESSKTESNGEVIDVGVDYSSKDDFETVVSWYKGELGEPDEIQQLPNGHYQAWWNLEKDGMSIMVIVTCTDEGTAISILTAKK